MCMGGLLEYSGLSTKIKAMKSKMLSVDDFVNLSEQNNISGIVAYLKKTECYGDVLANENENSIRRHRLELLIRTSLYKDYDKIYKFSHEQQKAYLKAYFVKYIVRIIKKAIRKCYRTGNDNFEIGTIDFEIFNKKSGIDAGALFEAENIEAIIAALDKTPYSNLLKMVYQKGDASLFDYETVLDIYFFSHLWKTCKKALDKKDLAIIQKNYGETIDMLNIIWLYRAKKYYDLSPAGLYSLVIPIHYKIKKQDMIFLAKTKSKDEFESVISKLPYVRKIGNFDEVNLEKIYDAHLEKLYTAGIKKFPYSIACIESYFYEKEEEIENIIQVIECVRYSMPKEKITDYIMGT